MAQIEPRSLASISKPALFWEQKRSASQKRMVCALFTFAWFTDNPEVDGKNTR
jgi:hypothetical protein